MICIKLRLVKALFLFMGLGLFAQNISISPDKKYREDQFYLILSYVLLVDFPQDISQNNFPYSIQLGFIRDFPVNRKRNVALALGLGYSTSSYYSSLRANLTNQEISYSSITSGVSYDRNKVEIHCLDIPFEFRWRTSTSENKRFWRIYTGLKYSYVFYGISKFVDGDFMESFENEDIQESVLTTYTTFNFKTKWNIYIAYGLTNIFNSSVKLNKAMVNIRPLQIGLSLYFL